MATKRGIQELTRQLLDPSRSNAALLGLLEIGREAVPALAEFLRTAKPSTVAEPRLLAVEALSLLRTGEGLEALCAVATENLAAIPDPAVRLAEESVVSRAARALAEFAEPQVRTTLLQLVRGKPLLGVAEAFERIKDPRALPALVYWLQEDFYAQAAERAIVATGHAAVPWLLAYLKQRETAYDLETGASQRRRALILEVLANLGGAHLVPVFEHHLDDPVEDVRWGAARALVQHGNNDQKRQALRVALQMLDSSANSRRVEGEELLAEHLHLCADLVEEEVRRRRAQGESEKPLAPRESTLEILLRLRGKIESLRRPTTQCKT